jgi:hypothetical protein
MLAFEANSKHVLTQRLRRTAAQSGTADMVSLPDGPVMAIVSRGSADTYALALP